MARKIFLVFAKNMYCQINPRNIILIVSFENLQQCGRESSGEDTPTTGTTLKMQFFRLPKKHFNLVVPNLVCNLGFKNSENQLLKFNLCNVYRSAHRLLLSFH